MADEMCPICGNLMWWSAEEGKFICDCEDQMEDMLDGGI